MKQKNYIVGLYLRLSKDDERQGESLSIEHQRTILRKYAEEQVITKDQVIAYLRNIAKYEPRFLINVFVKKIVLYNDKIEINYYYTDKKDPDEPTDKVHRDLTFHHYNVRVRKTYFGLLTKIKKGTAHCSRSSTVSLLVHRKRFELLAFGSVDRRYIQLS